MNVWKPFSTDCIIVAVLLLQSFVLAKGETFFSELEALTPAQRQTLDKFVKFAADKVPQEYMKKPIYLNKILQFNQYSLPKSEFHLERALKWRKEFKIDELLAKKDDGYFADMNKDYPIFQDAFDKEGRPIVELYFGQWNVRDASVAGKLKKLTEHILVNGMEVLTMRLAEQQAKRINVTQYVMLQNLEGFGVRTHICPTCIPFSITLAASLDHYYTNLAHGFWLINTPDVFATFFNLIKPAMSANTRAAFKVHTSNEREWKPWLEERVDFNQISHWFGGAKDRTQH